MWQGDSLACASSSNLSAIARGYPLSAEVGILVIKVPVSCLWDTLDFRQFPVAGTMRCTKNSSHQADDYSGNFSYEVPDREHFTGKVKFKVSAKARTMNTRGNMSGRWISASCGKM